MCEESLTWERTILQLCSCRSFWQFSRAAFTHNNRPRPSAKCPPTRWQTTPSNSCAKTFAPKGKKIVTANLPLTEDEAVKFWPVYDRYVVEHSKIYDVRYALIKEYAQNYNTLTGEQANSFIKRRTGTEEEMARLRLKWMPEFEK